MMCEAQDKVVACGRRWGKTEGGAVDDLTSMLTTPGWGSMVVGPSRDQVVINYRTARQFLDMCPDFAGIYKCRETPHPEISIGDRILLYRTSGDDGKYIRGHGKRIKRIRVDEAAYVKDSVIDGVIRPMCLDEGAELILQGTPFGKNHFYRRWREGDPNYERHVSYCRSFHFPTETNPHLDKRAYEQARLLLGEDSVQWRCEYLAEFVDSASSVFGWDLIESCFHDPWDARGTKEVFPSYICGVDLARYKDYTVAIVAGFDRGRIYVVDLDRFNEQDWVAAKSRVYDVLHPYHPVGCADATGEGDAVVDDLIRGEFVGDDTGRTRKRPGLLLEKVRIETNRIKRDLIDRLRVRMSQGLVKFPYPAADPVTGDDRWIRLVDELKYYGYRLTEGGRVTFAAESGGHDDIVMGMALLVKRAFGDFEPRCEVHTYPPDTFGWVCEELDRERHDGERMIIGR